MLSSPLPTHPTGSFRPVKKTKYVTPFSYPYVQYYISPPHFYLLHVIWAPLAETRALTSQHCMYWTQPISYFIFFLSIFQDTKVSIQCPTDIHFGSFYPISGIPSACKAGVANLLNIWFPIFVLNFENIALEFILQYPLFLIVYLELGNSLPVIKSFYCNIQHFGGYSAHIFQPSGVKG